DADTAAAARLLGLRIDGLWSPRVRRDCRRWRFAYGYYIQHPVDWFFAINEGSAAFGTYTQLAKVAVHTALTHTSLRPRMLYDGHENAFTKWMRDRDVDVIFAKSYLKDELPRLSGLITPAYLTLLPGVFLRMELPSLGVRLEIENKVLYTD